MDLTWMDTRVVHGIAWVIAVAGAVWILGPGVMFALGRRRFSFELNEDPTAAEPRDGDAVYQKYYQELYALGYRPVGRAVETIKYFSPIHWRWRSSGSRLMQSPDRKTTIAFYRVANHPLRFSATTLFEGGGALATVYTAMKQNARPKGNYRYVELLKTEPAQLVEDHAANVADFAERRDLKIKRATLREYCEENIEIEKRVLPISFGIGMYLIVASMYVMPAVMVLRPSSRVFNFDPWFHPAFVLCGAALLFALMRFAMLPSRVPTAVRMIPLFALMLIPSVFMGRLARGSDTAARAASAALDQLEAEADKGQPIEPVIDRIAAFGPKTCRSTLKRMAWQKVTPAQKRALHQTLVRLNGSDLGDAVEAWLPWCREAYRHPWPAVTPQPPGTTPPAPAMQTPASSGTRSAAAKD
jgi:hypothetical protein